MATFLGRKVIVSASILQALGINSHGFLSSIVAEIISFLLKKATIFIFSVLSPSFDFSKSIIRFFKVPPHPNLINGTLRLGSRNVFLLSAL